MSEIKDHYILEYPSGEGFVGIDKSAIPYQTNSPCFMFFWVNKGLAEDYIKQHPKLKLKLKQVEFTFFDV